MNISISVWISRYLYACRYLCAFIDIYYIHKGQLASSPMYMEPQVQEYVAHACVWGQPGVYSCRYDGRCGCVWVCLCEEVRTRRAWTRAPPRRQNGTPSFCALQRSGLRHRGGGSGVQAWVRQFGLSHIRVISESYPRHIRVIISRGGLVCSLECAGKKGTSSGLCVDQGILVNDFCKSSARLLRLSNFL